MMINQNGMAPFALIVVIFLALAGVFYLGTNSQNENASQPANLVTAPTPENTPYISPSPKVNTTPAITAKPVATAQPLDYGDYYWKMFPSDLPVYPGAKRASYYPQGQCKEELLNKNSNCLQVNFIFKVIASVEDVVNWYVTNPAPGWTYRGVYGDQRDYQFGDIYKNSRDLYYRMEFRYPNPDKAELEIYYNGPYPYSNLLPNP